MAKIKRRKLPKKPDPPRSAVGVSEEKIAEALEASCGIQTTAAKMIGLTQSGVSRRISTSPYLQQVIHEIREEILDICETELFKKIRSGNLTALIYYTKCFGKQRGYLEKAELDVRPVGDGGVLVVPGMAKSTEQWTEMFEKTQTEAQENARIH